MTTFEERLLAAAAMPTNTGDLFADTRAELVHRLLSAAVAASDVDNRYALSSIASSLVYDRPITRSLDKLHAAPKPAGSEGWHPDDIDKPKVRP